MDTVVIKTATILTNWRDRGNVFPAGYTGLAFTGIAKNSLLNRYSNEF